MSTLDELRRDYAKAISAESNIKSDALIAAFAKVPREQFLGPGPWKVISPEGNHDADHKPGRGYQTVDQPARLYENVLVAIDAARGLNNGLPSSLALWLDALELKPADRVYHVGCGVGYYTAIMAEVVAATGIAHESGEMSAAPGTALDAGHVVAIELDPTLAGRARQNLAGYNNVEVHQGDGATFDPGDCDVIFVNAGATHPQAVWLDRLRPKGRLMLPLTVAHTGEPEGGAMLLVTRQATGYAAGFVSMVYIFPCLGSRLDEYNQRLRKAFARENSRSVQSLRRDPHAEDVTCWLHGDNFCISVLPPPTPQPPI